MRSKSLGLAGGGGRKMVSQNWRDSSRAAASGSSGGVETVGGGAWLVRMLCWTDRSRSAILLLAGTAKKQELDSNQNYENNSVKKLD